jgi:putative isomerase
MRPASGWSPDCEPVILGAMPTDVPLSGREAPAGIALVGASAALGAEPPATSRSTQRAPLSSANLLLNCLFHADLKAAADLARRLGRADDGRRLTERVAAVAAPIRDQCWDPRDACFYTVDVQCVDRRAELIK